MRWSVGDGSSLWVFKDKWIPCPNSFMPITLNPGSNILVSDLIDRYRRGWNTVKIDQVLLPIDKVVIISIHISWSSGQDSLRWHFEKSGEYSVRRGYNLAVENNCQVSVSDPSNMCSRRSSLTAMGGGAVGEVSPPLVYDEEDPASLSHKRGRRFLEFEKGGETFPVHG
ncbi:hypothetical protein LWI28_011253 [Acer negundo]|uniref:Uncharacterized protein n=1 Tax=Acer negundo TaxID=4023 RepID=A0AAD5IQT5_ACENE|nr:hypothetical protein LWI28_011253 [Acer negundo]